jgi:predicted DNA-binding transcriptional regulator AlpA
MLHHLATWRNLMRIIRYPGLREKGIGYSRQQLRRKIAAGEFPQPITLDNREYPPSIAWIEQEIDAWIEQRAALRDTKQAA